MDIVEQASRIAFLRDWYHRYQDAIERSDAEMLNALELEAERDPALASIVEDILVAEVELAWTNSTEEERQAAHDAVKRALQRFEKESEQ